MSYGASAYIMQSDQLSTIPKGVDWDATPVPADPSQSLVIIRWDNPNHERDYEARPDVTALGRPWEAMDPSVASLLSSFAPQTATPSMALPSIDTASQPDTVYSALKKLDWGPARSIR